VDVVLAEPIEQVEDAGYDPAAVDALLGPQVPRLAAEWSLTGPDRPWRVLDGSFVFADISGFTALSERLAKQGTFGAEELTEVLGRCFTELLAVAYAGGGSLLKFGGDALLLLFDGEGHAGRAVEAAIGMQATMRTVGRLTTSVGNVRLRMSLGVHSGELHAFRVGRSHRELLLVGPGASAVVEMEGTASAGEIVVSPATASRIDASLLAGGKGPGVLLRTRRSVEVPAAPSYLPRLAGGDVAGSVPVTLRDHLLAGGGESEHRHASIAFLHFDGTDALLEAHGPAWLAEALEELVVDVQEACASHGVTFLASDLDHDGGKLILVAGVPRTMGDDEGRVLRAVRDIVARERAVPVRVGVNRGPVFSGEVGPPYRRTFTIMGDAVNLTARLMAKAGRGQVLASAPVLERSRTAFATTPLEPFFVKGKSKPVVAYLVGEPRGTQETRRSARLPFVGRDDEVAALADAWEAAAAGQGRALALVGDAGIGKTRLVEELRARTAASRLVQCEQYESATPFFAARLLVRAVLGPGPLLERVAAVAPSLLPWAPLLGDVLGEAVPETARTRDLDPRFRRERTVQVVVELLGALVDEPTVLAFEDVQWMDDPSAAVVVALAAAAPKRPWLVVATRRDEAGGPELPARLEVGPLDDAAAQALVAAATADAPVTPERRDALVARAEGNPLFLEELLSLGPDGDLPASLEAVVALQVDQLPPEPGRVLRVASVLGTSFPPVLLGRVLDEDPDLAQLRGHLVEEADGRLRFRHRLLRDVAYALLPHRRRRELHGRAAEAILDLGAADRPRDEVLSLHLAEAGRYDECLAVAARAAVRATKRYAQVEACVLLERALFAAQRTARPTGPVRMARLWDRLGKARQTRADYAGAAEAYRRARRLRPDNALHQAKLAIRHAEVAERQGRAAAASRWIHRGLRALDGLSTTEVRVERAHLLGHHAGLRWRMGHPRDALRLARRAVAEAQEAGPRGRAPMAAAYALLDIIQFSLGRPDRATYGDEALAIYRKLRDRQNAAQLLNNLGAFAYYQGRWGEALERYDEARRNFERLGNHVDAALGRSNIAEIFADQGRLDEAEALLHEVIATWRALEFPIGLARAERYLARVELRRGDAAGALARFESARATFDETGLLANVHEVDVWRAECLLHLGRLEEADALLASALALEVSSGSSEMRAMIHRLRAASAFAAGDLVTGWAELDESLHVARSRGAGFDVALALELLEVATRLGGRPHAEDARRERDELLRSLGVVAPPAPPLPRATVGC
jgi:class 3 adenylate cyclase/tetratricopeptide (TPR) repeat protein